MKKYCFLIYGVFILGTANAQYTVLHNFNDTNGFPRGSLKLVGKVLYGMTSVGPPPYSFSVFSIDTDGSDYKVLHEFDSTSCDAPGYGSLIYYAGKLYGMTSQEGTKNEGNVFSIDTNGNNYKDLFDFDSIHGIYPIGSLLLSGKVLYGMTSFYGTNGEGTIFSIDTNGSGFKDLFDFSGSNGAYPYGALILSGKVLYGMTSSGGFFGSVFSIDTDGSSFKNLYEFGGPGGDGDAPYGNLTLVGSVLYGMTSKGGLYSDGNIFSIDTNGSRFKDMLDFDGPSTFDNGEFPYGSLIVSGKLFYGMTGRNIFSIDTNGTKFKELFNDFNATNGEGPLGSLTLSGSTLYGMTAGGGTSNTGTIFKIDTSAVASVNNVTASKGSISVYPNPNNGTFTLSLSNVITASNIEIYNILGEKVYSETISQSQSNNTIDLTGHPSGVYFYRVLKEDGGLVGEGKVDVQK